MTTQLFGLALVVGSALLAFWILWRHTRFGPTSILWAIVHTILAMAALRSVPIVVDRLGGSGLPGVQWIEIFGIALPVLVYGFLSGGWVTKAALGLLRP